MEAHAHNFLLTGVSPDKLGETCPGKQFVHVHTVGNHVAVTSIAPQM